MRKLYKCEKCGRMVPVRSKGLCPLCRSRELPKKVYIKKNSNRGNKNGNPDLSGFFCAMLEKLSDVRMSYTGRPIYYPTVCNVCHILPKRTYKSVATDEDNIIFLTNEEHTRFDYLLDCCEFDKLEQEFPVVWKRALDKIMEMCNDGRVREKGNLITNILERYGREN